MGAGAPAQSVRCGQLACEGVGLEAEEGGSLAVVVALGVLDIGVQLLETPLEVWNKIIAVNLTGPWLGCQVAARRMVEGGEPERIINISPIHEERSMPTNSPYCAAKGACVC